jgi:hypothetical protein
VFSDDQGMGISLGIGAKLYWSLREIGEGDGGISPDHVILLVGELKGCAFCISEITEGMQYDMRPKKM